MFGLGFAPAVGFEQSLIVELRFVAEVVIHRGDVGFCASAYGADGGAFEAFFCEFLAGGANQAFFDGFHEAHANAGLKRMFETTVFRLMFSGKG